MSRSSSTAPLGGRVRLDTPINFLKGIGPSRAETLRRLGIITAGDLLWHVPRRYEDATTVRRIASLEAGMDATIIGRVISKGVIPTRKGLRIFQAVVRDESGIIEAAWPGQPFLDRVIHNDDTLLLTGPVRFFHGRQLNPREYVNLGADENPTGGGRVLSVYPATEGISIKLLRSLIEEHLEMLLPLVQDHLTDRLRVSAGVVPLREALRMVHTPLSIAEAERGRERLAFDEMFFVQLLHRRANRIAREQRSGIHFENKRRLTSSLRENLPYTLTGAQVHALREIVADMCSARRMHRLLQGDVGSGKTIVALFAALLAIENGYKAALMVPTELLAEQHQGTLTALLAPLGIEPLLFSGSVDARTRRGVLARMASDEPIVVVGTHALFQDDVQFRNLGFVAIDEQHRFGVAQREALTGKGGAPDTLLMSATPIPRSLALTMYGDLDISTLDERPPGRKPITTVSRHESARARVFSFLRSEIEAGRQAYVVYPVIDESEKTDLKAATVMFEQLSSSIFADLRVALLHGRVAPDERDRIMRLFRDGEIDILVATTVIEVGIDVPNASVMLIEHPERFGLSQLHQLRGRVGRGADASYCILLGDVGDESAERLAIFTATEDGFEIARKDLGLRGMGDLFGQRQSGEATFKIADPIRDEALNIKAHAEAELLLADDPDLAAPEHAEIRKVLTARYARALELFRVG